MNKMKLLIPLLIGAIGFIAFQFNFVTEYPIFQLTALLMVLECVIFYLVYVFSKCYMPDVNFESNRIYFKILASIIMGMHVFAAVVTLGVFFML